MEYKDPVAEEWEKFQKTIQREDEVGSAFVFSYMPAYLYLCALSLSLFILERYLRLCSLREMRRQRTKEK